MRFRPQQFRAAQSAFTMVEVAISLAIIGIALVAIIGVLPLGMNVQRDNREETVINQDATVFMDAISKGARGLDDLTNYVYAITNYWTEYKIVGGVVTLVTADNDGYSLTNSKITKITPPPFFPITNGLRIIGLLNTPQLTDLNFNPANDLFSGGYSNHVVAYVRSLSGAAVEKPPQDNPIIQQDAFGYRLLAVNAALPVYAPSFWVSGKPYASGDSVSFILNGQTTYWRAIAPTAATFFPNPSWVRDIYPQELAASLHEVRLTFLWPTLPSGGYGKGRQTYRTTVAGQISSINSFGQMLYFFQPQSFANSP